MMGIEASLKKLSIQLGHVMEANGQQDRGKPQGTSRPMPLLVLRVDILPRNVTQEVLSWASL